MKRVLAPPELRRPLVVELTRDLSAEDAVSSLRTLPGLAFLDSSGSSSGARDRGRYSYLTADPFATMSSRGTLVELRDARGWRLVDGDPFVVLSDALRDSHVDAIPELPPFQGGAVGYFGYDLGRVVERLPSVAIDDIGLPDLQIGFYDWTIAWDHHVGRCWLIATGLPAGSLRAAGERIDQVRQLLDTGPRPEGSVPVRAVLRSNVARADYLVAVERAQRYIQAGDIYQVNLSQRFTGHWAGDPWPLYRRLRRVSPVPYGAYLELNDCAILSGSPECFLHSDGRIVETHPIKGTRPRGVTAADDARLAAELATSVKDRAENVMIVDLLRNDLGRVCRVGSIAVPRLFGVEGYSHVWQLVSTVTGELRPELTTTDLLRAAFPGGSVTGCPKIRAMAIIEELEPVRRGVYCGAIGYVGFDGALGTSIVIRTLVLKDHRLHLQVGGAIVADSDPASEYEETLTKAAAALAAISGEIDAA